MYAQLKCDPAINRLDEMPTQNSFHYQVKIYLVILILILIALFGG